MAHVFDWRCCYYYENGGKWLYGHLKLYPRCLRFKADAGSLAMKSFAIDFRSITEVKRKTTSIFYNAMVISERGVYHHWFSSFSNVYDVLNVVEHFWKAVLFCPMDSDGSQRYYYFNIFQAIQNFRLVRSH